MEEVLQRLRICFREVRRRRRRRFVVFVFSAAIAIAIAAALVQLFEP